MYVEPMQYLQILHLKDTGSKRINTDWEKIFVNHESNKCLVSKTYEESAISVFKNTIN